MIVSSLLEKANLLKLSYLAFGIVVVFTFPVWFSLSPAIPRCPIIGPATSDASYCAIDFLFVILTLIGLGFGIFRDKLGIMGLGLLGMLICICLDLNRFNGLMHFFLSIWILYLLKNGNIELFKSAVLVFISFLYIWSGLNKLNIHFYDDTYRWIMDTLPITRPLMNVKWFSYIFPLLESIPAVMLLFNSTRRVAIVFLIAMHVYLITLIAFLDRENMIFVWNGFLIIVLIQFWNFSMDFRELISFKGNAKTISYLILVSILFPLLLGIDKVSSEFGYAMFSGRLTYADMVFTKSDVGKLDKTLHQYLEPIDSLYRMDIDNFSFTAYDSELCRMEFVQKKMFQELAKPFSDTCMLVITRRPMFQEPQYEFVYKE